jgi:hypothetical protein
MSRITSVRLAFAFLAAGVVPGCGSGGSGANGGSLGSVVPGGGGASGAGNTTGDASASTSDAGAPVGAAGVLGAGMCYALCANASTDLDGDNWGYENGASCIVPGTVEARSRLPCKVGGPLPTTNGPPAGSAGVVVDTACYPRCVAVTTSPMGDGYAWEFESTCVLPSSRMAAGLPCKTGTAVVLPDLTGAPGRLLNEVCISYCRTPSDPDGDGFGFEYASGCIVMGSLPATTMGIDCKVGDDFLKPTVVLNPSPPPGAVQKPAAVLSKGFFVANGNLYDKFGNAFVIRGVNNPHIWFDAANQYLAYQALDQIAALGANTIRIVWMTTGSPSNLARVIRRVVELRMVPMVELHDVTGGTLNQELARMVDFYVRPDVKDVLLAYESFLLVNIANEWSGTDFRNGYLAAITQLRAAGINHTLVIDSNAFGQNADTIFADGRPLLDADPQHNLLFSLHMYQEYAATTAGRAHITATLAQARTSSLPLIVGEFGPQLGGTMVDAQLIMSECVRLSIGYIAWSWKGNEANLAYLDMAVDWQGQMLTSWGTAVMRGANGIMMTARKPSIFTP